MRAIQNHAASIPFSEASLIIHGMDNGTQCCGVALPHTAGRGMVMELAFAIDRDGLVQDTHAVVYKQLGDWCGARFSTEIYT
jgi:hypothetical protein